MNKKLLVFTLLFVFVLMSSIFVSARIVELEAEQAYQKEAGRTIITSFLLILFIGIVIILGNWIRHIKEEKSSNYLLHGILGFLIGIMHIFISMGILSYLEMFEINHFFLWAALFTLFIGGLIAEFVFYKRTKKLFWIYTLIFSTIMITTLIILAFYTNVFIYFISALAGWR